MISTHGSDIHIQLPGLLLIFGRNAFMAAQRRGKAYKRAMARQVREQRMAISAEPKRERLT